ncbi:hypothetical protein SBV1_1570044 [Verrucomicrobia bacterium]|nr:hypothetical protein SBV1_1570044 [Verrucomicrobiota bacterium]
MIDPLAFKPNQGVEPMGGGRFSPPAFLSPWRLPPVAHARRWQKARRMCAKRKGLKTQRRQGEGKAKGKPLSPGEREIGRCAPLPPACAFVPLALCVQAFSLGWYERRLWRQGGVEETLARSGLPCRSAPPKAVSALRCATALHRCSSQ